MASDPTINSQITDAVTQVNTKLLGDAPASSLNNLYQATGQALANAAHNATAGQQPADVAAQAATTAGVAPLSSADPASSGNATNKILSSQ